jgi:methyl-accepting chemotaxis protein
MSNRADGGLFRYFLRPYADADYAEQQRARTSVWTALIIMLAAILLAASSLLLRGRPVTHPAVIASVTMLLLTLLSLVALKKGFRKGSAHLIVISTATAIWAVAFSDLRGQNPGDIFFTYVYIFPILAFAGLLTDRTSVFLYAVLQATLIVLLTYSLFSLGRIDRDLAINFGLDGIISALVFSGITAAFLGIELRARNIVDQRHAESMSRQSRIEALLAHSSDMASRLAATTEQLSVTSDRFSSGAQTQAASVEEITATIEEVAASGEEVLGLSRSQYSLSQRIQQLMRQLEAIVRHTAGEMSEALKLRDELTGLADRSKARIDEALQSMRRTQERFQEAKGTVSVIDEISDRINLLSLNASIEAARAGEHGRGFAVVAQEVGKLADSTSSNLKSVSDIFERGSSEIDQAHRQILAFHELLVQMTQSIGGFSERIDTVVRLTDQDLNLNEQAGEVATEMLESSRKVLTASQEQKGALNEMVKSVSVINNVTQEIARGALEISDSSRQLSRAAHELSEVAADHEGA